MKLDALGMERQFVDHLAPVWRAIPDAVRGTFLVDPSLVEHATARGLDVQPMPRPARSPAYPPPRLDGPPLLVASYGDVKVGRRLGYGPFALLQHGAGQSYAGDPGWRSEKVSGSYSGGPDHDDVELFLVPNETSAARWRDAYPGAAIAVVGEPRLPFLPRRDFTGLQLHVWTDFLAVILQTTPTFASIAGDTVCVAHAITAANQNARDSGSSTAIAPSRNTTVPGTFVVDLPPPVERDLASGLTEAIRSAMNRCTHGCVKSSRAAVHSVVPPMGVWRSLSIEIPLSIASDAIGNADSHSLRIGGITSGSASLAIPCTTIRDTNPGIRSIQDAGRSPVVCASFHWQTPHSLGPEAQTALGDYQPALGELARAFTVIGHAHPKGDWPERMRRIYQRAGIPFVADFDDVCRQADVYVCDNSSTIFEFAATGRPVVLLNSRWYRRHINHGLRFWDAAHVGHQVDRPTDLVETVRLALEDPPAVRAAREDALRIVYARRTGGDRAAARALEAWLASTRKAVA